MFAKCKEQWVFVAVFIALAASLCLAYSQSPLYRSDQNTHYFMAFAQEGHGFLENDWRAGMHDPTPLFTLLLRFTLRFLHEYFFYAYHSILFSIFFFSMLGIVSVIYNINFWKTRLQFLVFATAFIAIHSKLFSNLTDGLTWSWHNGLAGFRYPGSFFVPSVFCAFLFLSVYLFLRKKYVWSIVAAAIGSAFHPMLIIYSFCLVAGYCIALWLEKAPKKDILKICGWTAVLIGPSFLFTMLVMANSSTSDVMHEAKYILAYIRFPHHTVPSRWIAPLPDRTALVFVALWLLRKHKKLFYALLLPILGMTVMGILTVFFDSMTFAVFIPWRMMVLITPISLTIILGYIVSYVSKRIQKSSLRKSTKEYGAYLLAVLCIFVVILCAQDGYKRVRPYFSEGYRSLRIPEVRAMMDFVKETKEEGDTYLIPPTMKNPEELVKFRIETGAPIFVDIKVHPFKDDEVIEWYDRVQLAEKFYDSSNRERCAMIPSFIEDYDITHIVIKQGSFTCSNLEIIYENKIYKVLQVVE